MKDVNNSKINDYRNIFKATSLFGGVQLIQIVIQVIKQKIIAILLGPFGMGINGLYISSSSFIQGLTSLGLTSSAVKNIAEAYGSGDSDKISKIISVLKKIVWFTGLLGMLVLIITSPILSKVTFGNYDYTIPFIFLSITLLFQQLSNGQIIILQGLRRLKDLAKASVLGSFAGLIISAPIYYFFGINGIIPTLILSSITTLSFTWYFSSKLNYNKVELSIHDTLLEGKEMMKMGVVMSLNNILVLGVAFITRIIIMKTGNTEEVGLYNAGFVIINGYFGLIFNAMSTDYYPRLSAVNKDNRRTNEIVNQQTEISLLIISPLILFFLLLTPYIIQILYSKEFLPIIKFIQWAIIGMLFKTSSWAISYQFIAKSNVKQFAINELIANTIILTINTIGYLYWGLEGLGIAFTLSMILYFLQIYYSAYKCYSFKYTKETIRMKSLFIFIIVLSFIFVRFHDNYISFIIILFACIICMFYSLYKLNKLLYIFKSN